MDLRSPAAHRSNWALSDPSPARRTRLHGSDPCRASLRISRRNSLPHPKNHHRTRRPPHHSRSDKNEYFHKNFKPPSMRSFLASTSIQASIRSSPPSHETRSHRFARGAKAGMDRTSLAIILGEIKDKPSGAICRLRCASGITSLAGHDSTYRFRPRKADPNHSSITPLPSCFGRTTHRAPHRRTPRPRNRTQPRLPEPRISKALRHPNPPRTPPATHRSSPSLSHRLTNAHQRNRRTRRNARRPLFQQTISRTHGPKPHPLPPHHATLME